MNRLDRIAALVERIGDDSTLIKRKLDDAEDLAEQMAGLLPLLREWEAADVTRDGHAHPDARRRFLVADAALFSHLREDAK
jgi:hypothetical protein